MQKTKLARSISHIVSCGLMLSAATTYAQEQQQKGDAKVTLDTITVSGVTEDSANNDTPSEQTGQYHYKKSRTSTSLNLETKETPQSITSISQQQLDDFNLVTIEDALDLVPGINVEQVETDRTYYTARGFDVTNFQVDGLNTPTGTTFGNVQGDIDTVVYDRVEVIRGANGLSTGVGNPSATVNFIRKRPTTDFKSEFTGLTGSWDQYRGSADVSGSLNENATVRGRAIVAVEDKESYLDRYSKKRQVIYGIADVQLGDSSLLTLGHTYQRDEADSPMWGSLQLNYSDGSETDFDVSDSNAAEWSFWDNETHNSFIELTSEFENGWELLANYMHVKQISDSKLFYTYGALDPVDGSGMFALPSDYQAEIETDIVDFKVTGPLALAGREHEVIVGAQWSKTNLNQRSINGDTSGTAIDFETYLNGSFPHPEFNIPRGSGKLEEKQTSVYGSVKIDLADSFNLIAGTRYLDYEIEGNSYGSSADRTAKEWIPYLGAIYAINKKVNIYSSYTSIFQPQAEIDINRRPLDPVEGKTYEVGIKSSMNDDRALASMSVFRTEQDNLATLAGTIPGSIDGYYEGEDGVTVTGVEVDLQGEIANGWKVNGGYVYLDIEDSENQRTNTHIPKQTFKFATSYNLQSMPEWTIAGAYKWRDDAYGTSARQSAYSIFDASLSYEFTPKLEATLNVYNVFDKEYTASMRWAGVFGQGFSGEPRSAALSLEYKL